MSEESIKSPPTANITFASSLINSYPLSDVKFVCWNCLVNSNNSAFRKVINLYFSLKLDTWSRDWNTDLVVGNCLFGDVTLTKNVGVDKYGYSGYSIGFNGHSNFYYQTVAGARMSLFLKLIIALLW